MADGSTQGRQEAEEDAAARLEAALERIARVAARPAQDPQEEAARAARLAAVAGHLDALIAELREVLGTDAPDGTAADAAPTDATAGPESLPDPADPN